MLEARVERKLDQATSDNFGGAFVCRPKLRRAIDHSIDVSEIVETEYRFDLDPSSNEGFLEAHIKQRNVWQTRCACWSHNKDLRDLSQRNCISPDRHGLPFRKSPGIDPTCAHRDFPGQL